MLDPGVLFVILLGVFTVKSTRLSLAKVLLTFATIALSVYHPSEAVAEQKKGFQLAPLNWTPSQIASHARDISRMGGDIVRYPIYLTLDPSISNWVSSIRTLLATTEAEGMTVAVTLLWPDRNSQGSIIYDVPQFVNDWGALASALKGYKNIWYDLSNEPVNTDWDSIALQAARRIRSIDRVHPIVFAKLGASIGCKLSSYRPLPGISNQIFEAHFYDWPRIQFNVSPGYPDGNLNRKSLFAAVAAVQQTAKRFGVPAYIGETAIHRSNPSAASFLADFTYFARVLRVDTTLHAFREADLWNYERNRPALDAIKSWMDPFAVDLDSDGRSDIIHWEESTGTWYWKKSRESFRTTRKTQWGLPGDKPFVGDFNGDRKPDFAVYREGPVPYWFVLYSYTNSFGTTGNWAQIQWGLPGDIPVVGDFDQSGSTDLAVWRPSNGTWYIRRSTGSTYALQWGLSNDVPFPEDHDYDGADDPTVWRPTEGRYYFVPSSGGCPSNSRVHHHGCEVRL